MASSLQRKRFLRRFGLSLAVGIPVILATAWAAEEFWIGGSGVWSDSTHWLDGSAPPVGGDPALAIRILNPQGTSVLSQLDTGPFVLNSLTLEPRLASSLQVLGASGSSFRFGGTNPEIINLGNVAHTFAGPTLLSDLRITGNGLGLMTMNAPGESGGSRSVTIDMNLVRPDLGGVRFATTGTHSGGTFLQNGTLHFVSAGVGGGGGPFRIYGGYLSLNVTVFNKPVELYADLHIIRLPDTVWNSAIIGMTPSAGLILRDGNSLTLTAASTYTGETTIDRSLRPASAGGGSPTLILSGSGSLLSTSAINIRSGGRLTVEADAGAVTNRLSSTTVIRVQGAELRFSDTSGNGADKSEAVGPIEISGLSRVALVPGTSFLTLSTPQITRVDRGTLLVTGISAGGGLGRLTSTAAPVLTGSTSTNGTNLPIVPYAFGDTAATLNGSSFVTFTAANGYRLLDTATEYATTLSAGADRNVRLTGSTAVTAATMNSLLLAGSSTLVSGTLSITSGALATLNSNTMAANLNFGAAEGVITTAGSSTLTVNGIITGSNGLTKTGGGTLALKAAGNFSGPLTVSAGTINFTAADQLGNDTGPIILHGVGSGLSYSGLTPLSLERPFSLRSGSGVIRVSSFGDLTLTGGTSGSGAARFIGNTTGRLILTNAIQHTGPTIFQGGIISFASDNQLGAGGDVAVTSTSTLDLTGDWTSARRLDITSTLNLKPNGHNVTLSGPLTGTGTWTKTTAGTVRFTGNSTMSGPINFSSGRLELAGDAAIRSTSVTLSTGGRLIFENAVQPLSNRLADNVLTAISNGELRLEGHASTFVTETLGAIRRSYDNAAGSFALTLTAPGTAGTVLKLTDFESTISGGVYPALAPVLVITGDNLGGGPAGGYSRVVPTAAAAGFRKDLVVESSGVTSFAMNDVSIDSAGAIGLRPLLAAEYSAAALIANPGNGGLTPTTAHLLLGNMGFAAGLGNTAQDLTMEPGSTLTLAAGQTLSLSNGGVIARAGGTAARISGGTLDLGAAPMGLQLAGDLALTGQVTTSAAAILKGGPGTLRLEGGAQLGAPLFITSGAVSVTGANALATSTVYIAPAGTLEAASTTTFGVLWGDGLVRKSGAGTVTINDASQFTGPLQVAGGVARLSGVVGISSANDVTVEAGGQLEGSVTINRALTVRGSLAPGAGLGTLASRDLTFAGGSEFRLEIGSAGRDQASVTGAVTFEGLTQLNIQILDSFALGSGWAVLLNDSTDPIVTSATQGFALGSTVLTEGTIFNVGNQGFKITYKGGDGNDIYLTIPEPGAGSLLMTGALGLLARRRKWRMPD